MEFLAESIDGIVLLDMDDGRDRVAREAYNSSTSSDTDPSESDKQKKSLSIQLPPPPQPATRSFSFFTWGESSVDTRREEHCAAAAGAAVEEEDESCLATRREADEVEGENHDDDDNDEEQDLDASSLSLISSLSAASPLTLSASSLNLLPTTAMHDSQQHSERYSSLSATSPLTMSASSLNLLSTTTLSRQQHSETYDDTRSSCNVDSNDSNTVVEANSIPAPLSAASPAPSRISPSPAPPTINGGIWTKHVTQRIDARTNYDCFTGTVDAITGHLLHGTMIYRRTGDVYEGPFITKYVTSSKKKSYNNNNQDGRCYYGEGTAGIKGDVIIALRHGMDGMCRYSNGMTFEGAFEDDRPKAGKWTGGEGGWTYDGQLVGVDNNLLEEENHVGVGVMRTSLLLPSTSIGNRNRGSNRPKVIGIPHTLPGSVVFHGSGRFARPDGLVYQGDFLHGLANGVGKETSAHGRGVYHGEFFDGLRHGVGTLMEDYEEDSGDGAGLEGDCDCGCEEDVDERLHDQQEQVPLGDEFLSRLEDADNVISSTETDDSASPLEDNNDVDRQQSNHGPDFAAGGPQGAQTPISRSCRQCNPHPSRQQQRTKIKKKRYSSGVWCAGQCEIEDCRGTVHPESNEFMEDASSACASTIATSSLASGKSVLNDSFSSLNRTTWDMLDEKWLGI